MADKKNKREANTIRIIGYLKENNLELTTNSRGKVIRGSIIVATDEVSAHKVQFYVSETTKSGDKSKDFEGLAELLPQNTITIASYLKDNENADFKTASNASSKVWVMARFDEYASAKGENERSMILLKGFRAGFKQATDKTPFTPCAEFTVDVYINDMKDEVTYDENGEVQDETGRVIIEGLMPLYDKSVQKVTFVAPVEDNIADFINSHYHVGDTVTLKGDLVSLAERVLKPASEEKMFGRQEGPQYETRFTRERKILGGSMTPIHDGDEGAITDAFVKNGLAQRVIKMKANAEKEEARKTQDEAANDPDVQSFSSAAKTEASAEAPVEAPTKEAASDTDDMDF